MPQDQERLNAATPPRQPVAGRTRNWSVWHTLWTGVWLVSLGGMLYGYLSRNAPVTGASLLASLVPPPVLVFLEWRAKQQARRQAATSTRTVAGAEDQPRDRS